MIHQRGIYIHLHLIQLLMSHTPRRRLIASHDDAPIRRLNLRVHQKRVQRLMQTMRVQAVYPKPRTSTATKDQTIYPYPLRGIVMLHPHQVWSADSTYVR